MFRTLIGFGHERGKPRHIYDVRPRLLVYFHRWFCRWCGQSLRQTTRRRGRSRQIIQRPWIMGTKCKMASDIWRTISERRVCCSYTFSCILLLIKPRRLDGEVKLWDLRGPDRAAQTWNIHPNGLSAFDVHSQTGVFAAWAIRNFPQIAITLHVILFFRTSALSPTHWRDQRTMIQSVTRPAPLSNFNIPTGISAFPNSARGGGGPSPYIPRSTSLAFHPMEMLYGVGGPDGTGECPCSNLSRYPYVSFLLLVRIMGCKFA